MALKMGSVAVDCRDARRLAGFWAQALGYQVVSEEEEGVEIEAEGGSGWGIDFLVVPDEKVVKNRLHFDLIPDDQAAEVERLIALGATRADVGQPADVSWVVLADPEGNEFCILAARENGAGSA